MPNRRSPRQTIERATAQHAYQAFPGALDGASAVPAPVGEESRAGLEKRTPLVYFYQDRFPLAGGAQNLGLTYAPIANSEHAYILRGGVGAGRALLYGEDGGWKLGGGGMTAQLLYAADARNGDVLVVEYAYYEQAANPNTSPCGNKIYPSIIVPSSATVTRHPSAPGTLGMSYLPAPEGFPHIVPSGVDELATPDDPGIWRAMYVPYFDGNISVSAGPPLAPLSSGSRQVTADVTYSMHNLFIRSGDHRPRWSQAKYFGGSNYYAALPGDPTTDGTTASTVMRLSFHYALGTYQQTYSISIDYSPVYQRWSLTVQPGIYGMTIDALAGKSPYSSGTHYTSLNVDCATKTLTFKWDERTFTYTDSRIWFDQNYFSNETMPNLAGDTADIQLTSPALMYDERTTPSSTVLTERLTFSSDVPYCTWQ